MLQNVVIVVALPARSVVSVFNTESEKPPTKDGRKTFKRQEQREKVGRGTKEGRNGWEESRQRSSLANGCV